MHGIIHLLQLMEAVFAIIGVNFLLHEYTKMRNETFEEAQKRLQSKAVENS